MNRTTLVAGGAGLIDEIPLPSVPVTNLPSWCVPHDEEPVPVAMLDRLLGCPVTAIENDGDRILRMDLRMDEMLASPVVQA
jgi:hypothetical protein